KEDALAIAYVVSLIKDETPSIRQKLRPGVVLSSGVGRHRRQLRCRAVARGGHTPEAARRRRRKDDDAIAIPASAAPERRVRKDQRRAAADIDPFQLAIGEEPDRSVVGGPERERSTI